MKKTPTFFTLTFVWALLIVFTISARAQVTTADITGAVLDATGKIVPGATVTATNVGTSLSRTTTTNESGEYRISELPPGVYNLTVEAQNFSRAILKDLELTVGSRRTVNVDLRPGEVTETVEITADGNLIETTKSELDQ